MTTTPDPIGIEAVGIADEVASLHGHHPRLLNVPKHIGRAIAERVIAIRNGMPEGHFDSTDNALVTRYALVTALLQEDAVKRRPIDLVLVEELVVLSDMLHISPRARHVLTSARDMCAKQDALFILGRSVD